MVIDEGWGGRGEEGSRMSEQARMMTIELVQVRADCAQRAFVWHLDISSTSLLHPSLHICSSG